MARFTVKDLNKIFYEDGKAYQWILENNKMRFRRIPKLDALTINP